MTTLSILSIYSAVLPVVTGLCLLKHLSKSAILIWCIAVLGMLPQLLKAYTNRNELIDSAYNLYSAGEFILTYFLFKGKFIYRQSNRLFQYSSLVYILLASLVVYFNGITNGFLYEWICLNSFLYSLWIMVIILEQYKNESSHLEIKTRSGFFWFLVGTFIYSLCTFMVFAFWNFIKITSKDISDLVKSIHSVFNISLYVCFTIGLCLEFYFAKKKTRLNFNQII